MALNHRDRVKQAVTGGGTDALTLGAASLGYQAFAAGDNGLLFPYVIEDGTAWETGFGTYTHSGTSLARTTRKASSTGAALNVTTAAFLYVDWIADAAADVATGGGTATGSNTGDASGHAGLAPLASPTFTGTVSLPTPFTLGAVSVLTTGTALNFVDGVTSAIQTQLDARVDTTGNETIAGVKTFSSDPIIPDEAYGAGWNGSLEPPTKNAVYDKMETLGAGGGVDTANSPNATEFARFTDADTIEGRTAAETRTDLGLVIGTNVQAYAANLDEYAAVNPTAAGLALLDDADAAAQLVTLGITAAAAELNYTDGVTSAIQTQLNAKAPALGADDNYVTDAQLVVIGNTSGTNTGNQDLSALAPKASPTFTGTVTMPTPFTLGAVSVTPTGTELNFVDGVTSAIQTQLDARVDTTGDETIAGVKTFSSAPLIPDEAYGAGWNGALAPPTKNAVYDKIETLPGGHDAVTVTDSAEINFTLTGQDVTAVLINGSIDEARLDASVNASLDLADTAIQNLAGLGITSSSAELNFVDGVTSAIQTQLNAKAAALGADDNYVTDAEKIVIGNTSGTNTGNQATIVGITGTVAQFNAALTDGDFTTGGGTVTGTNTGDQTITLTGGVTGSGTGSFAATVVTNANLTGHVTSTGNAAVLGSFTVAQLNTAISDADVATGGGTATGTNTGDNTNFAAPLGADDNYVTDAEKVVIGNTSGANTGDQDLSTLAPKASPTFTGTVTLPTPFTLGAVSVTPTGTELNFVDGVTSAIQTQLDAKAADADVVHDTGTETIAGVKTFSSDPLIPDEAYGVGWNGSLEPPTKNAVYDKIETIGSGAVDTANSPNANEFARFTDANTIEGRTTAEAKTDLGLVVGTDIQAYSANLDEYAGVNPSAAGLALLDDADAAAQRATLSTHARAVVDSYINGFEMTWIGVAAIDIGPGAAYVESAAEIVRTTATASLTSLSLGNNAFGYVYLKSDGTFECNTTAPAAAAFAGASARSKTSDTSRRFIGFVRTDGGGSIYGFLHKVYGSRVELYYRADTDSAPFRVVAAFYNTTPQSQSFVAVAPANICQTIFTLFTVGLTVSTPAFADFFFGLDNDATKRLGGVGVAGVSDAIYASVTVEMVLNPSTPSSYLWNSAGSSANTAGYIDVTGVKYLR